MILPLAGSALAATGYVVPAASFDTDDGLGGGARGEIAWPSEVGGLPYRLSLVVHLYFATSGFQHLRFRLDRPGLGPAHHTRLTVYTAWRQWLHDGYYGIGNGTVREEAYAGAFADDDPAGDHYRYALYQPLAQVTVRQDLGDDGFGVYGAVDPKWSEVRPYPGSALAADDPYGVGGGPAVQGRAGVLHDTRDPEIAPRRGHFTELGVRGAPALGGEAGGFVGPIAHARGYVALGDRVVLAGRVMSEWLVGDVPFYEMVQWGGAFPAVGLGGPETLRGVAQGRWRAPAKAVANVELRTDVWRGHLRDDPLALEITPFVDAGTVWGAADPAPAAVPVHPAAGLGVRVVYAATFILRVDSGIGPDAVRAPDGSVRTGSNFSFYLTFDHPF